MNTPNIYTDRLIALNDGTPGLRSTIQIEVRESSLSSIGGEGQGEGELSSTLDFISSDETLDRYDEVITASGWKLDTYRKNPVFQNAHQYGDIIYTLGRALVTEVRSGKLHQRIQFAVDANPMARIAHALYSGKFLRAVSVGFIPLRWENGDGSESPSLSALRGGGQGDLASSSDSLRSTPHAPRSVPRRRYLEQELLEVSAVAIPANPNALALAYKSGTIEKSDLKELADLLRHTLLSSPGGEDQREVGLHPTSPPRPSSSETLSFARQFRNLLRHV